LAQYAFVEALASDPSNIVIGLARNKEATESRLATDGIMNAHILETDITDGKALELAAQQARQILGDKGLDVLINNAAYVSETTALKSLKDL
jgi:NAD(P)-dependent dehydrogenase (short-subunit alcohol dehydrogenase family)